MPHPLHRFQSAVIALSSATAAVSFPVSALPLADLPPSQLEILVWACAGGVLLFLILWLTGRFANKKLKRNTQGLEASLQRADEKLAGLNTGVLYYDDDLAILDINRSGAYLLGKKAESVTGQPAQALFPEEIKSDIAAAMQAKRETVFEVILPARNRHCRIRVNGQLAGSAGARGVIIVEDTHAYHVQRGKDIALQEHLESTLSITGLGHARVNVEQGNLELNDTLKKIGGFTTDRISVESFTDRVAEQDRQLLKTKFEKLSEGEAFELETRITHEDKDTPVSLHCRISEIAKDEPLRADILVDDLTIQKRDQSRILQQSKRFNLLQGLLPTGFYVLESNGVVSECNRAFAQLFNSDPMRIKGKPLTDLPLPDAWHNLHKEVSAQLAKRQTISFTDGQGQPRTISIVLQKLATEGSHPQIIALAEDLTASLQRDEEAKSAEQRLQQFMTRSPLGIAFLDGDLVLQNVNSALTDHLGAEREALQGQPLFSLFAEADAIEKAKTKLTRHDRLHEFAVLLKKPGGGVVSTTLYVSKLSERPEIYLCWFGGREEQDYLNSRFDKLLKYASVPVALLDDNGFTRLNSTACDFFGLQDEEDLLGRQLESQALTPDEEDNHALTEALALARSQGQVQTLTLRHHYDGNTLPCELTLIPQFRGDVLQSVMCLWLDLRAVEQANKARIEAVQQKEKAQETAQKAAADLKSSQSELAAHQRSLAETEAHLASTTNRLSEAEESLSEKVSALTTLQQKHEDISDHLASLKKDYEDNRTLLAQSQAANEELESQLVQSGEKVSRLESQRNQIADALQYSEKQNRKAQEQLNESRKETERLKQVQEEHRKEVGQYENQINALKTSIADKDKSLRDVSGQISVLQSQLTSSGQASEKLRQQLINQRKASEQAEKQRRELELACQRAEAELNGKSRQVDHMNHEMQMLETMLQQQKGDMESHTRQLQEELEAKQQQLSETESTLTQALEQRELDRKEREAEQARLAALQQDMEATRQRVAQEQAEREEAEARYRAERSELEKSLADKQAQLQQAETNLDQSREQSVEAQAEQQAVFDKLKQELSVMQQQATKQHAAISQQESQWQSKQGELENELQAREDELEKAKAELANRQQQMETDKLTRSEQEALVMQLKAELADVAKRTEMQKELNASSDEEWRKQRADIENQKSQLQAALDEAREQNSHMRSQLSSSLNDLKSAESQAQKTQDEEKQLQAELDKAREQADSLRKQLSQQAEQEAALREQVEAQQSTLQDREASIDALKVSQQELTDKLKHMQQEYDRSQENLNSQNTNQSALSDQLASLEEALTQSRSQLEEKEAALQSAQTRLKDSESKLAVQEEALISAQKADMQQAQPAPEAPRHPIADTPMPPDPDVWFALLPYLQAQREVSSLAKSLESLMDKLTDAINSMEEAVNGDDDRKIVLATRKLLYVLRPIHSAPLDDMADRFEADCEHNNIDNIAIFWPNAKRNLDKTLRVIYSHLSD